MAQYLTRNATQRITLGLVPVDSKTGASKLIWAMPMQRVAAQRRRYNFSAEKL
jgi:hypothetical protein